VRKYGEYNIKKFSSGFGKEESPQHSFLSEKVAMQVAGIWLYNFIRKYSPGIQWGVAPAPTTKSEDYGLTLISGDPLVIPKGAHNPEGAVAFMKFMTIPENMEILANGLEFFSPLVESTPGFYDNHHHPFIKIFQQVAEKGPAFTTPQTGIWMEYNRDLEEAFSRIWLNLEDPESVLKEIDERIQHVLDLELELLRKRGE
jgi:multiple sugar transport system substrate-binding protein